MPRCRRSPARRDNGPSPNPEVAARELGREISERLGYDPNLVAQITIDRHGVLVVLYRTDVDGNKIIKDGEPVIDIVYPFGWE